LQDALDFAEAHSGYGEIWVAAGTYRPPYEGDNYYDATFTMPSGDVAIRGHFGGFETDLNQRDFNDTAYDTILDGRVTGDEWPMASYLVTCDDIGPGLVLEGFTITGAGYRGISIINHSDPSIIRCKFDGNWGWGIYADNFSYPDIADSVFLANNEGGIYSSHSSWPYVKNCIFDYTGSYSYSRGLKGEYAKMLIEDCDIKGYSYRGIDFSYSTVTVIDCNIDDCYVSISSSTCELEISGCQIRNNFYRGIEAVNGSDIDVSGCTIENNGTGIYAASGSYPAIFNSTIKNNHEYGIYMDDCIQIRITNNMICRNGETEQEAGIFLTYSNSPPIVSNNTIVENIRYGIYIYYGMDPCLVNNIIYYNGSIPNVNIYSKEGLNGISASYNCLQDELAGTGNIDCEPRFRDRDANDFHLLVDSNCINAGAPDANYYGQTDIDGRPRVIYGRVDIGADEWLNAPDYNLDGFVNFEDFAFLAEVWLENDVSISLDDDDFVALEDLYMFAECWLWTAQTNRADYDRNGRVDNYDFAVFANAFGEKNAKINLFDDDWVDLYDLAVFCESWMWTIDWD
jgi:parallel beta-helix repeat protein